MKSELTTSDIDVLFTSLSYSKESISAASGTPPEVRKSNFERLEAVEKKLREIRNTLKASEKSDT